MGTLYFLPANHTNLTQHLWMIGLVKISED